MRIKRLLVDPIKNSTYLYHKNCVADSKENYKLDPGVKRLINIHNDDFIPKRLCT